MCGQTLLGNLVHAVGAYLHLYPVTLLRHQRDMERLIAIGLGLGHPVAQAIGMAAVNLGQSGINLEAVAHLVISVLRLEDDAYSQDVEYLVEGDVLVLHLAPNGVRRLYPLAYLVLKAHVVQNLLDGLCELLKGLVTRDLRGLQLMHDAVVVVGMFELEAEVLKLRLDFVQSETMSQRRVKVLCLACNLILFVSGLRVKRTHVVQAVGNLDEDDAYVFAHRQQQFLEVLGLCRSLLAEDAAADFRQSVDNLCNLRTEHILNVLNSVVGVFHHIVQQR